MNIKSLLLGVLSVFAVNAHNDDSCGEIVPNNSCVSFTVSAGTGCAWMCQYCENQLGTTNYYFTDGVCSYQSGGCVGSPQVGVTYTCCSS